MNRLSDRKSGGGVPPQAGSGHSAEPEPIFVVSADTASVPNANAEPDWFEVAKALATAIMFQRGTRGEHVVGKDGRARMGMCDLVGCYALDDAARDFCELAGLPFDSIEAPNEHQAFFMSVTGRTWRDWFADRDAIVAGAGPSPGRGKADLTRLASAIEARRAETQGGSVADESADARTPSEDPQ